MTSHPFDELTFSMVGVGRLGESLGRWLLAGGGRLAAVARRSPGGSPPPWVPTGVAVVPAQQLSSIDQDLLLIAVPDDDLLEVVAVLARRPQARVALHTSGARGAEALAAFAGSGTAVGALHPLRAFPRPAPGPDAAKGSFWAVDGDPAARELGERLVRAWGGCPGKVEAGLRPLYHLAATLAAGGALTLLASALELAERLGLDPAAGGGMIELAQSSLEQGVLERGGDRIEVDGRGSHHLLVAGAITGPAARGDLSYLAQLAALRRLQPTLHPLAVLVALESLRQRSLDGPLSTRQIELQRQLRALCAVPGFLDPISS